MFGTKSSKKVFVGLSGGVDSAVSAALLKKEGYDVTCAFIRIALPGYPCAAGEDKVWAQRAAAHLELPFVEVDLSPEYKKQVFELSMREFALGRTPNPDALCNREIKFGMFFDWCVEQGADYVATGHYARIAPESSLLRRDVHDPNSSAEDFPSLLMSADKEKDQSYFLSLVPEEKLAKTLFPIGDMQKAEVRAMARSLGLPNAARKDSQGLCFLGPVSIEEMLHQEIALAPGNVLNESGDVIGSHEGAQAYTLGQRHGFTVESDGDRSPLYVIGKNAAANTIVVSEARVPAGASKTEITLESVNWIGRVTAGRYMARYRYRQALIPTMLHENGSVTLEEPHAAPEGQVLALYSGERCMGGGIIAKARAC